MRNPITGMDSDVTICANYDCKNEIREGDRVWHKGIILYCSGKCLADSFSSWKPLREKYLEEERLKHAK